MTKYRTKSTLIKDIEAEHRRLENIIVTLTEDETIRSGVVGEWSVKDILAHLTAWEQQFLVWYRDGLRGVVSEISPVGMNRKAIDSFNQRVFEKYRRVSLPDVIKQFVASYDEILTMIGTIPEQDMFQPRKFFWTDKFVLADYVAGNTCNHYYWARRKIREWLKSHGKILKSS